VEAVVCPVHQAQRELQGNLVVQANQVPQVSQEIQESHRLNHANLLHHHRANRAQQDLLVPQVHPAHLEMLELQASPEALAKILHQGSRVRKDHQDQLDSQELQDSQESQVHQLRANHSCLASQDPRAMPERQDNLELQVSQVPMEVPDQQARKDPLVPLVNQEMMVNPVSQVKLDQPEARERRESAPNTALSMEESSSRMELVVVKHHRATQQPYIRRGEQFTAIHYSKILFFTYALFVVRRRFNIERIVEMNKKYE